MTNGEGPATAEAERAPANDDGAGQAGATDATRPRRWRIWPRRRWTRVLFVSSACLLALLLAGTGWLYWRTDQALDSIERIPNAIPTLPEGDQPPRVAEDALVFLLVGLDADETPDAETGPAWQAGAARSDTMMLLELSADRETASLVSIPRDTWVDIPGHGEAKLNAAYSWGGPPLMVETVQNLTGIRVDHLAVMDWSGFRELTDAVGGVAINGRDMNGGQALAYVREREPSPAATSTAPAASSTSCAP